MHRLTVLEQNGTRLEPLATLPNDARPDPIGKPGEDLYAVRFEGDMAYLVTFLRTDPLYAIDLSDPSDPKIAGELEIPGFASYMHPLTGDYLFTLGMNADEFGGVQGMKFELVKLEEGQPRVIDQVLLSDAYYSEALTNLRALSVLKVSDQQYRFAVPLQRIGSNTPSGYGVALQLLEVDLTEQALHDRGAIASTSVDEYGHSQLERGLLQDDAVFYASGDAVLAAPFDAPEHAVAAEDLRERAQCDEYESESFYLRLRPLDGGELESCPDLDFVQSNRAGLTEFTLGGDLKEGVCAYTGPKDAYGTFNSTLDVPGYYQSPLYFQVYRNQCELQTVDLDISLQPLPEPVPCGNELSPSLAVDVRLGGQGDACEAEVTAFNESTLALHTLTGKPTDTGSCLFEGPYEREGYFVLTISLAGYLPFTDYAYVYGGVCSVNTAEFSVQLEPEAVLDPEPEPTEPAPEPVED